MSGDVRTPQASTDTRVLRDDCFLHDKVRLTHAEALDILRDRLSPIAGTEICPIEGAMGRVVARAAIAPTNVPQADNAAVDGYAFAHDSYVARNGRLPVTMRLQAGDRPPGSLAKGEAARIFTGAIMPDGADSIAMQEDCSLEDGEPTGGVHPGRAEARCKPSPRGRGFRSRCGSGGSRAQTDGPRSCRPGLHRF
jgi:molybdopterin molybdotransferase